VLAYWDASIAGQWSPCRGELTQVDIRLLHFLVSKGGAIAAELKKVFATEPQPSLARLEAAELVRYEDHCWHAAPLAEIFAVRRLVSIEAKVRQWRAGLQQALHNTWFSSESYLLLPSLPSDACFTEARRLGIGLIVSDRSLDLPAGAPRYEPIPKSYMSWLFNEWVWRSASKVS
jgi:hypothetical protein